MRKINNFYLNWRRRLLSQRVKMELDLSDISIISMNCIGGVLYHDCHQKFLSPTVNLYFTAKDFIRFIDNMDMYLEETPHVIMGTQFPIGTLRDIKIYFMHYTSCQEALAKWEERKNRINKNKIFIIMVERDGFCAETFESFKKITYPKFLYTKTKEYECKESLFMSEYKNESQLPDIIPGRYMYKEMKLVHAIKNAYG